MGRQIGLDAAVHVHVVPYREPLVDRHDLRQPATQVAGHPQDTLGGNLLIAQRAVRNLQQPHQAAGKVPGVPGIIGRHAIKRIVAAADA